MVKLLTEGIQRYIGRSTELKPEARPGSTFYEVDTSRVYVYGPAGGWRLQLQQVSGAVSVGNLPAVQPVSGALAVTNLPAVQPVSGAVDVANLPAVQTVAGVVDVGNLPATQPVSGTVGVSNFPATQPVSGNVGVNNFPATQPVSGTVAVSNLSDPLPVDGTVDIRNIGDLLDPMTDVLTVITIDHAAIHAGRGYSVYVTKDALANGASFDTAFVTPEDDFVHLKFYDTWISNAAGLFLIYENPTSVAAPEGTVTPVNRRRPNTPGTSAVTVSYGVTTNLAGATLLETLRFGGGGTGPQGRTGGDRSTDIEWILKQDTLYVFRVTNQSGVAANIGMWLFWYEEEKG